MQPLCVGQQTKVLQVVRAPICCLENQNRKKRCVSVFCFVFCFPAAVRAVSAACCRSSVQGFSDPAHSWFLSVLTSGGTRSSRWALQSLLWTVHTQWSWCSLPLTSAFFSAVFGNCQWAEDQAHAVLQREASTLIEGGTASALWLLIEAVQMEAESRNVPFSCFHEHFYLEPIPIFPFWFDWIHAFDVYFVFIGFYFYFQTFTTQTFLPTKQHDTKPKSKTHSIYDEQQNTHTLCFCLLYSVIYLICIIIQDNMIVFCVVWPDVQTLSDVLKCSFPHRTAFFTRDSEETVKKVMRHCGSPGVWSGSIFQFGYCVRCAAVCLACALSSPRRVWMASSNRKDLLSSSSWRAAFSIACHAKCNYANFSFLFFFFPTEYNAK